MMKKPELLMPAGDKDTFYTALHYGADAVYVGGEAFSLRAKATNFSDADLKEIVDYAHNQNKKVYVTINIYPKEDMLDGFEKYLDVLNDIKPDGVLISDIGVLKKAKEKLKNIDLHISTQANTTNSDACLMYKELGAKRVVLARELSLIDIKKIKEKVKDSIELECFVHGAMCMSISGRCLLSSYMTGRSANLGACTHPCRWKYSLVEEQREGEYIPIEEDKNGTYIFNSKDLCMIDHIDDLMNIGIDSIKIEGRMKTELYVASIARAYRKAIDLCYSDIDAYKKNIDILKDEVTKCTYRLYTTGFYYGMPMDDLIYDNSTYVKGATYYGTIKEAKDNVGYLTQKNKFCVGDILTCMKKDMNDVSVKILDIYDMDNNVSVESCPHSKMNLRVMFDKNVEKGDILRS